MTLIGPYTLLVLAGAALSFLYWQRHARRDRRLIGIYFGALAGAFFGAKVVFLLCEGWLAWRSPDRWPALLAGKTILGALLGGYAGVEFAKHVAGYRAPTGDLFAVVAPLGIAIGRVGCLVHGCCLGVQCEPAWWTERDLHGAARWPAVPVEIGFNVTAALALLLCRQRGLLCGQLFHVYLMAYGAFRFAHEWLRDTPRLTGNFSPYQLAALAVFALGALGFWHRRRLAGA
jgi:phosphatidylglycerol:prolipoprotein diacylglycerol transferase